MQQLLTLGRKTEIEKESIDINALIQRLTSSIKETFPKNIETTLELAAVLPPMLADPNQINQVLLNLCVNARDAMPDGGKLSLKTSLVGEEILEAYGELEAQPYMAIEILDTGTGMDEYVQKSSSPSSPARKLAEGLDSVLLWFMVL